MKGTPEEVLKDIPDFDDFMKISDEIVALMHRKMVLESKLKEGEANVFKIASTDSAYLQGGKPPAVSYIENTFKHSGLNGELLDMRLELADVLSKLEGRKTVMDLYKTMIDVWRTLCSNSRTASF